MPLVRCEVSPSYAEWRRVVAVKDIYGKRQFLGVAKDFLTTRDGQPYLPVGVVHVDREKGVALIEFEQETDSGYHRLWVPLTDLLLPSEAPR